MIWDSFLGPSRGLRSRKAGIERTVNGYIEESEDGKPVLYRSPGLEQRYAHGTAARVRGALELNDHVFAAIGTDLVDIVAGFTGATVGTIANDNGRVWMAASPTTLMVVSSGTLYRLHGGALVPVALGFVPANVAFLDNYFVVLSRDTNEIYFDDTDGATWDAADVQGIESDANRYLSMIVDSEVLFVYGNRTLQPFAVGRNTNAPFDVQRGGIIQMGIGARGAITTCGGARYWIGRNRDGQGGVYRSRGYGYEKCSSRAVERAIRTYGDISDAVAWDAHLEGRDIVRFVFPSANLGLGATWEYDATEDGRPHDVRWTEQLRWNTSQGRYEAHRGYCCVSAFNEIIVGDRDNGKLYAMSPDYDDDDLANGGDRMKVLRRSQHVTNGPAATEYGDFWLKIDAQGDGSNADPELGAVTPEANPQIAMRFSDDGGENYNNELYRNVGQQGAALPLQVWERGGAAYDRVYEVTFEAAVPFAITEAGFEPKGLRS